MKPMKIKKYIWLPVVLALYATAMTLYFGPGLIAEGQSAKLWISVGVEAAFITGLFFALRRKERLQSLRGANRKEKG